MLVYSIIMKLKMLPPIWAQRYSSQNSVLGYCYEVHWPHENTKSQSSK